MPSLIMYKVSVVLTLVCVAAQGAPQDVSHKPAEGAAYLPGQETGDLYILGDQLLRRTWLGYNTQDQTDNNENSLGHGNFDDFIFENNYLGNNIFPVEKDVVKPADTPIEVKDYFFDVQNNIEISDHSDTIIDNTNSIENTVSPLGTSHVMNPLIDYGLSLGMPTYVGQVDSSLSSQPPEAVSMYGLGTDQPGQHESLSSQSPETISTYGLGNNQPDQHESLISQPPKTISIYGSGTVQPTDDVLQYDTPIDATDFNTFSNNILGVSGGDYTSTNSQGTTVVQIKDMNTFNNISGNSTEVKEGANIIEDLVTSRSIRNLPEEELQTAESLDIYKMIPKLMARQEAMMEILGQVVNKLDKISDVDAKVDNLTSTLRTREDKDARLEGRLDAVEWQVKEAGASLASLDGDMLQLLAASITNTTQNATDSQNSTLSEGPTTATPDIHNTATELDIVEPISTTLTPTSDEFLQKLVDDVDGALANLDSLSSDIFVNITEYIEPGTVPEVNLDAAADKISFQQHLAAQKNITAAMFTAGIEGLAQVMSLLQAGRQEDEDRMNALLHTTAARQRRLQDSLLTALGALSITIRNTSLDAIKKLESRVGTLEADLSASSKRHAKELAAVVLEGANRTFTGALGVIDTTLEHILHEQVNNSYDLSRILALVHDIQNVSLLSSRNMCPEGVTKDELEDLEALWNSSDLQELVSVMSIIDIDGHNVTAIPDNDMLAYTIDSYDNHVNSAVSDNDNVNSSDLETKKFWNYLDNRITLLKKLFTSKIIGMEEKMSGLKIYYSTSLHMHSNKMTTAMTELRNSIMETVIRSSVKMQRHIEKHRQYTHNQIDAAVVSVSSAAVTSAQSSTDQIMQSMHTMANILDDRLHELQLSIVSMLKGCPPEYSHVGSTCLLALPDTFINWMEARQLCQTSGGDLALIPKPGDLSHLKAFLQYTQMYENRLPPPYWVGARKLHGGDWTWLNGTTVTDISISSLESNELEEDVEECLNVSWGIQPEAQPSLCTTTQAVLCQFDPSPIIKPHS